MILAVCRLGKASAFVRPIAVLLLSLFQGSIVYGDDVSLGRHTTTDVTVRTSTSDENTGRKSEGEPITVDRKTSTADIQTSIEIPTSASSSKPDSTPSKTSTQNSQSNTRITTSRTSRDIDILPDESTSRDFTPGDQRNSSIQTHTNIQVTNKNSTKKILHTGSLLDQSMPSVPNYMGVDSELPPLRQILFVAPDIPAAENQRRMLSKYGLSIISRKKLTALGLILSTYRVQKDIDIDRLITQLQDRFPDAAVERNQRFRLLSANSRPIDKHTHGQALVGLEVPSQCRQPIRLAMLDSAVSREFLSIHSTRIRLHNVTSSTTPPYNHGTAIASLLISESEQYPGLLPLAFMDVINVFSKDQHGNPETRTNWLLFGLNLLPELNPPPKAVNLSFGGQHSALLETALEKLSKAIHFAAAAGNDGTHTLIYPAAYESVYAVGAVDAKGQLTRMSNRGEHLALMAPGEDIWTIDGSGQGFYASGTSFATPFATAALALLNTYNLSVSKYIGSLGASQLVSFRDLCP